MIRVIDGYCIEVESDCCTLKEDTGTFTKNGDKFWRIIGYFPTVKSCLKRVVKELVADNLKDRTVDLKEAIAVINECNKRVEEAIDSTIKNV